MAHAQKSVLTRLNLLVDDHRSLGSKTFVIAVTNLHCKYAKFASFIRFNIAPVPQVKSFAHIMTI